MRPIAPRAAPAARKGHGTGPQLGIPPSHYVSPPPASEREAAEPQPDAEDRELVVTTVSMAGDPD